MLTEFVAIQLFPIKNKIVVFNCKIKLYFKLQFENTDTVQYNMCITEKYYCQKSSVVNVLATYFTDELNLFTRQFTNIKLPNHFSVKKKKEYVAN